MLVRLFRLKNGDVVLSNGRGIFVHGFGKNLYLPNEEETKEIIAWFKTVAELSDNKIERLEDLRPRDTFRLPAIERERLELPDAEYMLLMKYDQERISVACKVTKEKLELSGNTLVVKNIR